MIIHSQKCSRQWAGFTLTEILVVLAIIAILTGLIIPKILDGIDSAKDVKCISNLRQLGAATLVYVAEKGFFPVSFETGNGPHNNWQIELNPYLLGDKRVKHCPAAVLPNKGDSHYSLNQNIFYDPASPNARFKDPKVGALIERPAEVILIMDGLQNSAGNAQGGLTQFRGSDAPAQFDALVNPFQNQAADGKAGGGFPSYRHKVRSETDRAANAVFADGHAAPVHWGTVKNRHLVIRLKDN